MARAGGLSRVPRFAWLSIPAAENGGPFPDRRPAYDDDSILQPDRAVSPIDRIEW
jgi:hypothetical protein